MKTSTIKTKSLLVYMPALLGMLLVQGCSSLPDMPSMSDFSLFSNDEDDADDNTPEVGDMSMPSSIEKAEANRELVNSLNEYKAEWDELKPAINRVIQLEEELSFMVEHLGNLNPVSNFRPTNGDQEALGSVPNFASSNAVTPGQFLDASASTEPNFNDEDSTTSSPQTGAAQPVDKFRGTPVNQNTSNGLDVATDNKFSGMTAQTSNTTPMTTSIQPPSNFASMDDKFSGMGDSCSVDDRATNNSYAVHIASFSKMESVMRSWTDFEKELNDVTCRKYPLVEEVMVNNKVFYSLRMGPFNDRAAADTACSTIRQVRGYCGVIKLAGDRL